MHSRQSSILMEENFTGLKFNKSELKYLKYLKCLKLRVSKYFMHFKYFKHFRHFFTLSTFEVYCYNVPYRELWIGVAS